MVSPTFSHVVNGLSVDVEDYFHVSAFEPVVQREKWGTFESRVVANTERLLRLFAETGVRATFFVLGWVAEREPSLVQRIAAQHHEIACHGYWHRLVYHQSPAEFREDVRRSKSVLEALTGRPVLGFRAPSFSITKSCLWALDILAEEGFVYDASIFPIRHDRYGIPGAPRHAHRVGGRYGVQSRDVTGISLLEVPSSTVRLGGMTLPVSGGGYFRLLPYAWTRWGIRRVNEREGRPVVFYLHPWEVDPEQPRLPGSRLSRLRHYRNLEKTEQRLRRLLEDFKFGPIVDSIGITAPRHPVMLDDRAAFGLIDIS
jgi:polysaccharide deacetylase family protein (PEP-CTERM system associated)